LQQQCHAALFPTATAFARACCGKKIRGIFFRFAGIRRLDIQRRKIVEKIVRIFSGQRWLQAAFNAPRCVCVCVAECGSIEKIKGPFFEPATVLNGRFSWDRVPFFLYWLLYSDEKSGPKSNWLGKEKIAQRFSKCKVKRV
jgi:hypothetical protein